MVTDSSYDIRAVTAVAAVLNDLHSLFAGMGRAIVLIGGSLPAQMCSAGPAHKGTIDIDLVVSEVKGETIPPLDFRTKLLNNDFAEGDSKNKFTRETSNGDRVLVELLAGETAWKASQFIKVGDAQALRVKGTELAYRYNEPIDVGKLRAAAPVAFLCLKAFAASDNNRKKSPKDFYDIVYYVKYYRAGQRRIVESIREASDDALATEGISRLFDLFKNIDSKGPTQYARFFTGGNVGELSRDVFETIGSLRIAVGR
ncbi:hypothetical protein IT570_03615 [Candidatus Sumerlaeota bacterium]|nr:hypothetical protein [Candidatus Sumerlaeota bacterium]